MKIERISIGTKAIYHYTAGGIIEKKFESKDPSIHIVEGLAYIENYCTNNGFSGFSIDSGHFYIKKD